MIDETALLEETVALVRELAENLTPLRDIALLAGLDEDDLALAMECRSSMLRKVILTARARTALMLRRRQIELARIGSPVGIQSADKWLHDIECDNDC